MADRLRSFRALIVLLAVSSGCAAAVPCATPQDIPPGANLDDLGRQFFGDTRYGIAIALATNARTGEGFRYIANPDDLSGVTRVCVPAKAEARELERSWVRYEKAVMAARLPRAADLGKNMVTIPAGKPVSVVAWMRADQAARLKTPDGAWIAAAQADTWVTVEPHLQEFCRKAAQDQTSRKKGLDEARLTGRLEQRLGLSPSSNKTVFVRIKLEQPGPAVIFRPCSDPATDQAGCATGPPKTAGEYQNWFLQQYYYSYGNSLISEFPWTALGYTFDWGTAAGNASAFQRFGESEFVIRKGAPITIVETQTTVQYCAASH